MNANSYIRQLARALPHPRLKRALRRLLTPSLAVQPRLFGEFEFAVDLSLGSLQQSLYLAPEHYEVPTQQLLRRLLQPGMKVLDVGANVGFFTLLMARAVGRTGRVFAFEPYEPNFRLLKRNLESNRIDWAEPHQIALSDHVGTAVLSVNPVNDGGHTLGDFSATPELVTWEPGKHAVSVRTETIGDFLRARRLATVDFLKIDVEGAEMLVLAGATELLSAAQAPLIVAEVGDAAQRLFGKTERDLREQLYSFGYRSYFIEPEVKEFGVETSVLGLPNILFAKSDHGLDAVRHA